MTKRTLRTLPAGLRPVTLNERNAAAYVGVAPNTFRKMVRLGLMPKPKKVGGRNLNVIAELDKAIAALPVDGSEAAADVPSSVLRDWD
ncbi:MAG: hypothetical protein WAK01_10125 [Methylocystis sp.]